MPAARGLVACFSYLAAASLWQVERFPAPGHGAEVLATAPSIAADGPMVAAVLAALSQPSLLLANNIGDDASGVQVREWLTRLRVATTANVEPGLATPQIVVVGDNHDTRTMFPYLPGIARSLERIDLAPLASAALAYIDCYRLMTVPAARAIAAARAAGTLLLANLGGDPPSPEITGALAGYPVSSSRPASPNPHRTSPMRPPPSCRQPQGPSGPSSQPGQPEPRPSAAQSA